ncbi:MAG: DUF1015 family protein [Kiritimatiellae bacterium]|nr:DUF1015 family protein [Kiritimatiellia bacterium]
MAARIASPPYDVVSREEAARIAEGNPACFLRVSRADLELPPEVPADAPQVYARAAANWRRCLAEGWFLQDSEPSLYAYEQSIGRHRQVGVVGVYPVADYELGVVRKHEHTRAEPEADRARHIAATGIQSGPVFLAVRDAAGALWRALREVSERPDPLFDFCAPDGVRHRGWRLESLAEWVSLLAAEPAAYIADGHHRAAAAARVARERAGGAVPPDADAEWAWVLAVVFPAASLRILPYQRCVRDLGPLTEARLLARVRDVFELEPLSGPSPAAAGEVVMGLRSGWWRLRLIGPRPSDPVAALEVQLLQDRLLGPVLGITDPRRDSRLAFVGGEGSLEELTKWLAGGRAAAVFAVPPVAMDQIMAVADAGGVMPPKSTWFDPKLRSGLFVHAID